MKKIFLFLISTLFSVCLFAEYNRFNIPDSAEIRPLLVERWFEAPLSSLRFNVPEIYANKIGNKFQVRMEENDETFNVFVSPETMLNVRVYSDKGFTIQEQAVYPGDIQGSWVLVRDKKTEKPLRIRYYFLKDSDVYIQFTPYNRTTLVDLVIFDNYAAKGVSAGVPFEKFYTASIQDVYDLTQKIIPWDYVTVNSEDYQNILQIEKEIALMSAKVMTMLDEIHLALTGFTLILDDLNDKTVEYYYNVIEEIEDAVDMKEERRGIRPRKDFPTLIQTNSYANEVVALTINKKAIKEFLGYEEEFWEHIQENDETALRTNYEGVVNTAYAIYISNSDGTVNRVRMYIPEIADLDGALLAIKTYQKAHAIYKSIGKVYDASGFEVDEEVMTKFQDEYLAEQIQLKLN